MPKVMIFVLIANDAFTGANDKTPYNLHHFYSASLNAEIERQLYQLKG